MPTPKGEVEGDLATLGACLGGGSACSGGCLLQGGACSRGVPARGGVGGDPHDGYCCRWYASYWNAFLFNKIFIKSFIFFTWTIEYMKFGKKCLEPCSDRTSSSFPQLGYEFDSSDGKLNW